MVHICSKLKDHTKHAFKNPGFLRSDLIRSSFALTGSNKVEKNALVGIFELIASITTILPPAGLVSLRILLTLLALKISFARSISLKCSYAAVARLKFIEDFFGCSCTAVRVGFCLLYLVLL